MRGTAKATCRACADQSTVVGLSGFPLGGTNLATPSATDASATAAATAAAAFASSLAAFAASSSETDVSSVAADFGRASVNALASEAE